MAMTMNKTMMKRGMYIFSPFPEVPLWAILSDLNQYHDNLRITCDKFTRISSPAGIIYTIKLQIIMTAPESEESQKGFSGTSR
jgi:hypothetical protein